MPSVSAIPFNHYSCVSQTVLYYDRILISLRLCTVLPSHPYLSQTVYNEVKLMREACGEAHMKTILAVGELGSLANVYKASLVCMMAGADFIKTSTGEATAGEGNVGCLELCCLSSSDLARYWPFSHVFSSPTFDRS